MFRKTKTHRGIPPYRISLKIGYLKFDSIVGSTAAEFNQLAAQVKREKKQGLILDFRDAVGASELHHAMMLADALVGACAHWPTRNRLMVDSEIRTRSEHALPKIPTVVLYNQHAPGSLFLILSTLKAHSNAVLMGPAVRSNMFLRPCG